METDNIKRMITKKGCLVKSLYFIFYDFIMERKDIYFNDFFDENTAVLLSNNLTIGFLNKLLNNLPYYSEKIRLSQRSLNRASKDLVTMKHIDYSVLPKTGEYDIDFIEELLLMDFLP